MSETINYLTPEGHERLREELSMLLKAERPQVVQAVSDAAAMGDRSENAEYIYGKKRLREIDRRIRFLQKRLERIEVIDPNTLPCDKVAFGLWVTIENEEGEQKCYQIVGPDEIDPKQNKITFSSPLGKALLGKKPGDEVTVKAPSGTQELAILTISAARP